MTQVNTDLAKSRTSRQSDDILPKRIEIAGQTVWDLRSFVWSIRELQETQTRLEESIRSLESLGRNQAGAMSGNTRQLKRQSSTLGDAVSKASALADQLYDSASETEPVLTSWAKIGDIVHIKGVECTCFYPDPEYPEQAGIEIIVGGRLAEVLFLDRKITTGAREAVESASRYLVVGSARYDYSNSELHKNSAWICLHPCNEQGALLDRKYPIELCISGTFSTAVIKTGFRDLNDFVPPRESHTQPYDPHADIDRIRLADKANAAA